MVRSMYAAIAGLKAHQSKMDVIGNNIANVNTYGYKKMSTTFKESMYQTISSGSAGSVTDGGYGGTNPSMIGYGSMVSAIQSNFTTGSPASTGNATDCAIDGTAFFAVGPIYNNGEARTPDELYLSRVGDFQIVNGYLVDGNGYYIYGNTMTTANTSSKSDSTGTTPGEYTFMFADDVPAVGDTDYKTGAKVTEVSAGVWDPAAGTYKYTVKYELDSDSEQTYTEVLSAGDAEPNPGDDYKGGKVVNIINNTDGTKSVVYEAKPTYTDDVTQKLPAVGDAYKGGKVTNAEAINGTGGVVGFKVSYEVSSTNSTNLGGEFDDGRMVFDEATGGYTLGDNVSSLKPLKLPTTGSYYDDAGVLQTETDIIYDSFSIGSDGMLYATSSASKRTYLVGNIPLVSVPNPGGMTKTDGPYYQIGGSTGDPTIVQTGTDNANLMTGYLEMANVDIATEFSDMITTQRGFQANSKIITVTDEMLEQLVNMKR